MAAAAQAADERAAKKARAIKSIEMNEEGTLYTVELMVNVDIFLA